MLNIKTIIFVASIFAITIILSACSSNHDHGPTPNGLQILVNGQVVAQQVGTVVSYPNGGNSIGLVAGEQVVATVQFTLASGEPYNYSVEDGYLLQFNNTAPNVVNITHPFEGNQWSLRLSALQEGTASMVFELWHVDHSDFESRNFAVTVLAPETE
jgi:hypothetical protein